MRKLKFLKNSVQDPESGKNIKRQEWDLIRALLWSGTLHWMDGFLIFDSWRTKEQKKDYLARFMVIANRASKALEDRGFGARVKSIRNGEGDWELAFDSQKDFATNINQGVKLLRQGHKLLTFGDNSGWDKVMIAMKEFPPPRSIWQCIIHADSLPSKQDLYEEDLIAIKGMMEHYRDEILAQAVIRVVDKASSTENQGITFEQASGSLARWIVEILDVNETLDLFKSKVISRHRIADKDAAYFVRLVVELAEYPSETSTRADIDIRYQKPAQSFCDEHDKSVLLKKLSACSFVARIAESVAGHFDKMREPGIEGSDVYNLLNSAIFEFAHEHGSKLEKTKSIEGLFQRDLRRYVRGRQKGRDVHHRICNSETLTNPEKKAELLSILRQIKGTDSIEVSKAKQIADFIRGPERLTPVPGSLVEGVGQVGEASEVARYILSFDAFMRDRREGFVGREAAFKAVKALINDRSCDSGYLIVWGDPGIGKSAFIAELIKREQLDVYHFNIELQGLNSVRQCIGNICARLIGRFDLPYTRLPDRFEEDSSFLASLLDESAIRLAGRQKLIIAVDALDEVSVPSSLRGNNPLFLPSALPSGVYVVLTARTKYGMSLQSSNIREYTLESKSAENEHDARKFITNRASARGIQSWMKDKKLSRKSFIDLMWDKSEGNFMYLHHVLAAIDRGELAGFSGQELPHGLRAYYRFHWTNMQRQKKEFNRIYRPVVCVLATVREAVSIAEVADWTRLTPTEVRRVIRGWWEFLHKEPAGRSKMQYRVYHKAFQEFLKEEVDPDLKTYHAMIADAALAKIRPRKRKQ